MIRTREGTELGVHDALDLKDLVSHELNQRRESGYEVSHLEPAVDAAVTAGEQGELERLLEELERAPRASGWTYEEPSDAAAIAAARREVPLATPLDLDDAELRSRIHAAWLGRCAGCNLGKPFEGMDRVSIRDYLDFAGAYPLTDWVPRLDPLPERFASVARAAESVRGNVRAMPRDDDIDYTVLGLLLLEQHGLDYTSDDVARAWLELLPFLQIFTAERVAYRNLLHGIAPPETARVRNPYREWIGAQIRADVFGYVCPGDPAAAAGLAYNDAAVSHVANGIYGEQWAAALVAASFTAPSMIEALAVASLVVPPRSRLAEALDLVADHHAAGASWDGLRDVLEARYGQLDFVHTIQNAAVVAAALLWGEGDFTRTIGLAVEGGWDTDCNGATAGSAFGVMHGLEGIPEHWTAPLNDTIRSALFGYDGARISDLAARTACLAAARSEAYT
jgi:ADP-ribosylglycohydrolase